MRGRNGGEQNLSKEQGPLDEPPPQRMCPEMEEDERMKEKLPSILSKDRFFFPYSKRRTNREAGRGLGSKEKGRLFQAQKQIKEVFWQNTGCDGATHVRHSDTHTHARSYKHKPA